MFSKFPMSCFYQTSIWNLYFQQICILRKTLKYSLLRISPQSISLKNISLSNILVNNVMDVELWMSFVNLIFPSILPFGVFVFCSKEKKRQGMNLSKIFYYQDTRGSKIMYKNSSCLVQSQSHSWNITFHIKSVFLAMG